MGPLLTEVISLHRRFRLLLSNGGVYRAPPLPDDLPSPGMAMVTGPDSSLLGATALSMLQRGWKLVMPAAVTTQGQLPDAPCRLRIDCEAGSRTIRGGASDATLGSPEAWTIAMATSGSTGTPRLFAFTGAQIRRVAQWYRDIYGLTEHSLVITSLPVAHNLAFVAGLCTTALVGAAFAPSVDGAELLREVRQRAQEHDRVVILANPVALETMLERVGELPDHVIIDSGGAPLSQTALRWIRSRVCDIREGYGTTETLSLTHFDRGDSDDAIGTVGTPLPGIRCRILVPRPVIEVSSPLLGAPMTGALRATERSPWIETGDLGEFTPAGNLRLLGRNQDHPVAQLWPRDVLDIVGPVLGSRTALVTHDDPATIRIRTLMPLSEADDAAMRLRIAERISGDAKVRILCDSESHVLYSVKLSRPPPA